MSSHRILLVMDRMRRRVRTLVLLAGLLRFATLLTGGVLLIGLVDWLVWLPAGVRLALTLVLLSSLGAVVMKHMVRPLSSPLQRVTLACRLERTLEPFSNRLSSAVQFLESPPLGSSHMMAEVIRRADADIDRADLDAAFSHRLLWKRSSGLIAPAVLLALLAVALPYWPRIALARMVYPFGNTLWPRSVEIIPLTHSSKVCLGGDFTTEMRVGRGDKPTLRAFVHTLRDDGHREVFPMQRGADGTYRWRLEGLLRNHRYWFEAGDDSTQSRPGLLEIVAPPAFESVVLKVQTPDYAPQQYEVRLPLDTGRVEVLAGSRLELEAQVNKPPWRNEDGTLEAYVLTSRGEKLAFVQDSGSGALRRELIPTEPVDVLLQLRGKDGFWNESQPEYRIVPRPDRPPTISIIEPAASLDVTPQSSVNMWLSLSDDVRLASLVLRAQLAGADEPLPMLELNAQLDRATRDAEAPSDLQAKSPSRQDRREVRYTWELGPLGLHPGDVVTYHLEVTDNFGLDGAPGHSVSSAAMHLRVLSQAQFTDRLQVEFQLLRGQLRELLNEQESLLSAAEQMREDRRPGEPLGTEVLEDLGRIAAAQSRLASRTGQLAHRFEQVLERMRRNRYEDDSAERDTKRIAHELRLVGEGVMADAATQADRAQQADSAASQDKHLQALAGAQRQSTDTLERLLQELQRWGSFQEMVRKTQEMLDRQERVTQETAELHRRTLGIPLGDLDDADLESATQQARRQDRLADEASELIRRMADMAEVTRESEPSTSDSLAEAERAGRAGDLPRRLHQAASAIRRNRAGRAAADQKAAESILRNMLQRVQNRRARQLWELARRAEQAEELVAYFLRQQIELRERTRAAAAEQHPSARYAEQAVEQKELEGNTRQLAKDLSGNLDTARPARRIRTAAGKMGSAAERLRRGLGSEAEPFQSTAIDELQAAVEALREARREAQRKLAAQAVLGIRNELIEIHNSQLAIAGEFEELLAVRNKQGRMHRKQNRQLARLGSTQEELKGRMQKLSEQVRQAVVYEWVFEKIVADMDAAAQRLARRAMQQQTADLLTSIAEALARAIDSLDLADVQPEDQFAESGSETSGAGKAHGIKPVPTVAEMKLLKRLQTDINTRTAELDRRVDHDHPSEEHLRAMIELAEQQEQVRNLTSNMFERQR
jgi:hypothetical protein